MKLFKRLLPLFLVGIFFVSLNVWHLPTENVSVLQVTTKQKVFAVQETDTIYTTDPEVIAQLSNVAFKRFSLKTTSPETVLSSLFAVHVSTETTENAQVEYYFSPLLQEYVVVNGNKVNLQVAVSGEETAIGYPLLDIGF